MLELGVLKGSHRCVKHVNSRGIWGHAHPRKFLKIMCREIEFWGIPSIVIVISVSGNLAGVHMMTIAQYSFKLGMLSTPS